MAVKYLFFDIDDTLFPSAEFAELARKNAIRGMIEMGLQKDAETVYADLQQIIKEKGPNYTRHFNELCRRYKVKGMAKMVAAAIAAYHNTKAAILPYPEVPLTLLRLREKGYYLYIATNGNPIKQWDKLIRMGIALYFEDVFVSDDIGIEKGPEFFRHVLNKLKIRPEECMMIGDKPGSDIAPAKKIGMITVRVKRGKYRSLISNADYEIKDLTFIEKILERLKK